MGFFSWDCLKCGHPMLSSYAIGCAEDADEKCGKDNSWMKDVVAIYPNDNLIIGEYDGYGRIDGRDIMDSMYDFSGTVYHQNCWERAGKPGFTKPSEGSGDQGYFFGDHTHCINEEEIK